MAERYAIVVPVRRRKPRLFVGPHRKAGVVRVDSTTGEPPRGALQDDLEAFKCDLCLTMYETRYQAEECAFSHG